MNDYDLIDRLCVGRLAIEEAIAAPVRTKRRMYTLLANGDFGNTIPQYFSVAEWLASTESGRYRYWGVRTLKPGGPCRLNCPADEVPATAGGFTTSGNAINISCMVDRAVTVTLWADVYDSPSGLLVYGVEYPPKGGSWRALMPSEGRQSEGVRAVMLLRRHLNASSLADLEALRERYPGHVYELSACRECFGTVPGRNGVIWEVRQY